MLCAWQNDRGEFYFFLVRHVKPRKTDATLTAVKNSPLVRFGFLGYTRLHSGFVVPVPDLQRA